MIEQVCWESAKKMIKLSPSPSPSKAMQDGCSRASITQEHGVLAITRVRGVRKKLCLGAVGVEFV